MVKAIATKCAPALAAVRSRNRAVSDCRGGESPARRSGGRAIGFFRLVAGEAPTGALSGTDRETGKAERSTSREVDCPRSREVDKSRSRRIVGLSNRLGLFRRLRIVKCQMDVADCRPPRVANRRIGNRQTVVERLTRGQLRKKRTARFCLWPKDFPASRLLCVRSPGAR